MNYSIYTKAGELRKNPPPKYVRRFDQRPVPNSRLKKLRLTGITFLVGPNGEALVENPDYQEWVRLKREHDSYITANRI